MLPDALLPSELSITAAIVLTATSFLTSAISATFGLGGGVAMLIALLSFTPPVVALPLHAIIQIGSNAGRAAMMKRYIMKDIVLWFIPGTILGILIACQLFFSLDASWLQIILAVFILWCVWAPKLSARSVSTKTYFTIGTVTSFATLFLGATGPLLGVFLTPNRYGRDATVSTHAACMMLQHIVKVIAFGFLGFVILDWIPLVATMIVSGLFGTWIGGKLLQHIPEAAFTICFKIVLSLLALRLLIKGFIG